MFVRGSLLSGPSHEGNDSTVVLIVFCANLCGRCTAVILIMVFSLALAMCRHAWMGFNVDHSYALRAKKTTKGMKKN